MPPTGPRRPGCENCRARHLKCDGNKPCAQCVKKRIQCNRNLRVRFRHNSSSSGSHPEFSNNQVWCKTLGKKLKFLDQSLEVARSYEDDSDSEDDDGPHRGGPSSPPTDNALVPAITPKGTNIWGIEAGSMRQAEDKILSNTSSGFPGTASEVAGFELDTSQRSDHVPSTTTPPSTHHGFVDNDHRNFSLEVRNTLSPYSVLQYGVSPRLDVTGAPLNERGKAELFRYFVTNIGPAFDAYDPNKYFTELIPSKATLSLPLLELILAVSAWHSHATQGNPLESTKLEVNLHQLVLTGIDGDDLDVALLLHQFLLNMDGAKNDYGMTAGSPSNILGAPLASRALETFNDDILWARLRQEMFVAILNQEPLTPNFDRSKLDLITRTRDDRARANRALVELMDTVQYCFGTDKNTSTYDSLLASSSAWMMTNPSSFTPVMIRRRQPGDIFPEIWVLNDCVAAGLQYFHLARILLIVYDPRVPQLCRARKQASRWIETQTKNDLEIICGIADSIGDINPMHITACMAISMVGDRFTEPNQQHALFDILVKTTNTYGLSTEPAQKHLLEAWNWSTAKG